jgi:hypothetical protein
MLSQWSWLMINADRFRVGRRHSVDQAAEASWGSILYRGTTAVAVLILVLAVANYVYNISQNRPLVPLIPLVAAGIVWLMGYGLRYFLTDR